MTGKESSVMQALKNSRGIALVAIIMMMMILLTITGAGLLLSGLNLKTTSNFKLGTVALQAADAGVQHSLMTIPWGTTFTYNSQATLLNAYAFAGGYTYTVTAINDSASPGGNSRAKLTATATGPNNTKKVILAYVKRGWGGGPGAVYLPGAANTIETGFSGNSFLISGNDTNVDGTPGPQPPGLGIAVTDQATVTEMTNSTLTDGGLSSDQMANVTGAGGYPSVGVITSFSQTVTQVADGFLAFPHTDLPGGTQAGNQTWGTDASPQITRITGDTKITGNISGSGVLIVDGKLEIPGSVTFHGLIIARGKVSVEITGNAGIWGSIFINEQTNQDPDKELDVRGNAHIYYSSQALSSVNNNWPATLPQPARLLAWQEVM